MSTTPLPHQQRVIDEKATLEIKIAALEAFMKGPLVRTLPAREQELLDMQLGVMLQYLGILEERIERFGGQS